MKDKDIYRWRYNKDFLEKRNLKVSAGIIYWCCSCIGVWDAKKQRLWDTYWSGLDGKSFNLEEIEQDLILTYVGNFDDLVKVGSAAEFGKYDDKDCVDLTHANCMRGEYYIRKGAVESVEKKKTVIRHKIANAIADLRYGMMQLENLNKQLRELEEGAK